MKLSTKARYAIIAMSDIVLYGNQSPVSLSEINTRQGISLSYLEQLFAKLKSSGLVKSIRGPGGGYSLNKNPSDINLMDIITAVDERIDQTQCGGAMNCHKDKPCLTHFIWLELNEKISEYMRTITLGDISDREDVKKIIIYRESKNVNAYETK